MQWLISREPVLAIPKAATLQHVRDNAAAADIVLDEADVKEIDRLCTQPCVCVPTDRIRVVTHSSHPAYRTAEEARENRLGLAPSPSELAQALRSGEMLKPVRVVPTSDASGAFDYDLTEGRARYWAWVIAHGSTHPIPAFIHEPSA